MSIKFFEIIPIIRLFLRTACSDGASGAVAAAVSLVPHGHLHAGPKGGSLPGGSPGVAQHWLRASLSVWPCSAHFLSQSLSSLAC